MGESEFRKALRALARRQLWLRPLRLARLGRMVRSRQPRWSGILAKSRSRWDEARSASRRGPKILIATSTGLHLGLTTVDSLLAVALTLRGADVSVLLCDGALPACQMCEYNWFPDTARFAATGPQPDLCRPCFEPSAKMFEGLGLPLLRYSTYLSDEDRRNADDIANTLPLDEIKPFVLDGISIGEHAFSGTVRHFASTRVLDEPFGEEVLRRYLRASLYTHAVFQRLLQEQRFDAVVFHHGIYVPQGTAAETTRRARVRVVTWNPAYRKHCLIFSHDETYHHTLMNEPTSVWDNIHFDEELESMTVQYLESRRIGSSDWIGFHEKPRFDRAAIARELGIDFTKPCIGLLTNVVWDAQLHYPNNAFPNMIEWLTDTIRYFADRPELQLLIRVHPAELLGHPVSRQPVVAEIARHFPKLPPNVFVLAPDSSHSTYAAMEACNAVVIYATKTGVELTSIGLPVIVAGEAWIRHKGLTMDAADKDTYAKYLEALPLPARLPPEQVRRARQYAFHFFFRRMIPLEILAPTGGWPLYRVDLDNLAPLESGASAGLDVICDGILKGLPFIYPFEALVKASRDTLAVT